MKLKKKYLAISTSFPKSIFFCKYKQYQSYPEAHIHQRSIIETANIKIVPLEAEAVNEIEESINHTTLVIYARQVRLSTTITTVVLIQYKYY